MYKLRYLIVGMPRSGTTATHLFLRGHPDVAALYPEIYVQPFFSTGIQSFTYGNGCTKEEIRLGYIKLFDALAEAGYETTSQVVGMKCCPSNPDDTNRLKICLQKFFPEVKIIYVNRDDIIAQYSSFMLAKRTNIWHAKQTVKSQQDNLSILPDKNIIKIIDVNTKKNNTEVLNFKLDSKDFIIYVLNYLRTKSIFESFKKSHDTIEINYEKDIMKNGLKNNTFLFDFLGLKKMQPIWFDSVKLSPKPETYIDNLAEIELVLEEILNFNKNNSKHVYIPQKYKHKIQTKKLIDKSIYMIKMFDRSFKKLKTNK